MSIGAAIGALVRDAIRAALLDVHTTFPGKVVSVRRDATGWLVDVKPQQLRHLPKRGGGTVTEELPVIPDVPVLWPAAGGWGLSMPIEAGDHVLVVASEHAIGEWRARGEVCDPGLRGRHDLNGCFALPGASTAGRFFSDALSAAAESGIVIGKDGGIQIAISTSEIKLGRSATSYAAKADAVLDRLDAIRTAFNAHTHVETGSTTNAVLVPQQIPTMTSVAASKVRVE